MSHSHSPPTLRERVAAAILEAAATVLADRGDQASMGDVASAAGVARATLYRYFPTREALQDAVTAHALDEAGGRLDDAGLDRVEAHDAFARAVRALVTVGPAIVVLARERHRGAPPEFEQRIAAPLRDLVDRGQEAGEIRSDVPGQWLVESLLALIVSVVTSARGLGPEDAAEAVTGLFLRGAATPRQAGS